MKNLQMFFLIAATVNTFDSTSDATDGTTTLFVTVFRNHQI